MSAHDPILLVPCKPHFAFDREIIPAMFDLMLKSNGCGLAAPQIGIPARMFITMWGEVFVNPVIRSHSPNTTTSVEGCLSLPGVKVAVPRWDWVEINHNIYEGLSARIVQHEMDHLDGKLITDYA